MRTWQAAGTKASAGGQLTHGPGLCPGNNESEGKRLSGDLAKGIGGETGADPSRLIPYATGRAISMLASAVWLRDVDANALCYSSRTNTAHSLLDAQSTEFRDLVRIILTV